MSQTAALLSSVLPGRGTRPRLGGSARIWAFVAAIGAAAAATFVFGALALPTAPEHSPFAWIGLVALFYLAEAYVIHLHFRHEAHSISLNEFGIVLGLIFVSPGHLLAAQLLGSCGALLLHRKQRPVKAAFNLAQFALTTALAIVIYNALKDSVGSELGPTEWLAAFIAATTACLTGVLLVAAAISLAEARMGGRTLVSVAAVSLMGTFANTSLAVAAAKLVDIDWRASMLLVVPVAACAVAYRSQSVHRQQFQHLEFLYESMRTVQEAPQFGIAVRQLLAAARQLVHAEVAEILLLPADGSERVLRSSVGRDAETLMQPSTLSPLERIALESLADTGPMLIGAQHEPNPLDGYLAERRFREAILAPLRGEQRIIGLVVLADREGDVESLKKHDVKLVTTFAGHASVLLENDRLEQSIAELTMLKEQLHHQAYHDSLTGLPNRALFAERVAAALEHGDIGRTAVLFVDLDDFKAINDSLGHAAGDELLKVVTERVRKYIRGQDTAARIGGDEFGVLIEEGQPGDAERLAERLVSSLARPMNVGGRHVSMHMSVGIAHGDRSARTAGELLRNADVAMYSAKTDGKRRYAVYEPSMHERIHRRNELSIALERAVEEHQITLCYQPIVDLSDGRAVALEALARWRHPERGPIRPDEFIPLAEEAGLMIPLGQKLLRDACRQASLLQRELGLDTLSLNVNLAPSEFLNPQLAEDVEAVLAETGLVPNRLVLEITESGAMRDPEATIETMRALRRLGVRLALDDFGTGHSSLSHLRDFPIDFIKVAKPFVDRIESDAVGLTFVETILRLAESLGLQAVAEGIEAGSQASMLESVGCRLGQGFHYAKPLRPAELPMYLRTGLRLVA
jgi:diguanylate cyclase (GGDEF)-like protein